MKPIAMLIAGAVALSLFGCQSNKPPPDRDLKPKGAVRESDRQFNSAIVHSYRNEMADKAIIREQMIYPYHFVVNSTSFTELGQFNMDVLVNHYMVNPGSLGVRRGDETKELYDARVQVVLESLKTAGVRMDRVTVSDGMPGGDGITSDRVVIIQKRMEKAETTAGSDSSQDSSSGNGMSTDFKSSAGSVTGSGGYK